MKILLVCAAGMSTSLLKKDMLEKSEPGTVVEAFGFSFNELGAVIDNYDVVLVGPQLGYRLQKIKGIAAEHGKQAAGIDPLAYGRCQGDVVLAQAKELIESGKGK